MSRSPVCSTVCRSIVVLLATGSLVACGPEPTPTTAPTPSPVVSQTPTESAQERQQRIDYEAAEKAYRTFELSSGESSVTAEQRRRLP